MKSAVEIMFLPEMPIANECDRIISTILENHLDDVIPSFQGFKDFDTCMSFQKAFRSWGVTGSGLIDSIAHDALDDSRLFDYFYNNFVLMQFDEYKKMLEKHKQENNIDTKQSS